MVLALARIGAGRRGDGVRDARLLALLRPPLHGCRLPSSLTSHNDDLRMNEQADAVLVAGDRVKILSNGSNVRVSKIQGL